MGNNGEDWRSNISYSFLFSIKKLFFFQNVSLTKAEAQGRFSRQDAVGKGPPSPLSDEFIPCGWGSPWLLCGHRSENPIWKSHLSRISWCMEITWLFKPKLASCTFLVDVYRYFLCSHYTQAKCDVSDQFQSPTWGQGTLYSGYN